MATGCSSHTKLGNNLDGVVSNAQIGEQIMHVAATWDYAGFELCYEGVIDNNTLVLQVLHNGGAVPSMVYIPINNNAAVFYKGGVKYFLSNIIFTNSTLSCDISCVKSGE